MVTRRSLFILISLSLLAPSGQAQSSNASATAAGVAAGAALGANAGQSSTTPSATGSSTAPIEIDIMVYGGLKRIALKIATDIDTVLPRHERATVPPPPAPPPTNPPTPTKSASNQPCNGNPTRSVLLEDSASAPLIGLYKTFLAYRDNLHSVIDPLLSKVADDSRQIQTLVKTDADEAGSPQKNKANPKLNSYNFTVPSDSTVTVQGGGAASAPASGGTGAAAASPLSLTYLSGISAAVSAAKNGITYTSSSVQPTTQAFTTELAKDLCARGIDLYTSMSAVNPPEPNQVVVDIDALWSINAEIQSHALASMPTVHNDAYKAQIRALVSDIAARAAIAAQLMSAFQTWLLSGDSAGNIILTDVIHGYTLNHYIGDGIPSLQVTIDAAGGNTRTNSFFLLNLFYTPRPSFNGGAIVTYELRDKENAYIAGDTLKALYGYSKWKAQTFDMGQGAENADGTALGTGH